MKYLLVALMVITGTTAFSQIANPVKWQYTTKKLSDKEYEVHMTAYIEKGWHLYAQDAGEGPEPTTVVFSKNPLVKLDEKVREDGKLEKSFDPNFNSVLKYYSNKVSFVQKVKLKTSAATVLKGTVTYMVCNDAKCLPPKEVPFSFKLQGK